MNETLTLIKELSAVIVALIGALGVIIVAYINAYHQRKTKQLELEKDNLRKEAKKAKIELGVLTLFFTYDFYDFLDERVAEIFEKTKATRFLVLFAINGKENFNSATVAYEHTKDSRSEGAIRRYVRIPIDNYYRNMLKAAESGNSYDVHTDQLPKDSLLYRIYSSKEEEVKHSRIKFIKRLHIDEDNDLLLYASIGTHDQEPFTEQEIHEISIAINGIRSKANNIKIQ